MWFIILLKATKKQSFIFKKAAGGQIDPLTFLLLRGSIQVPKNFMKLVFIAKYLTSL